MKKPISTALLLLFAGVIFSQNYMDKIAQKSCDCLTTISDEMGPDQFNMELGLCMIEAAMPYKKQIKKDYDIDMDKIEVEGERLGRVIGLKMASICPSALMKISRQQKEESEPASTVQTARGAVVKVENEFFVVFSLKDDSGKVTKYYWLTFIESEDDLASSYLALKGKSVRISYETMEFFDPTLKEYRQFNVVNKIDLID